jgi:hypothetical protein
VICGSSTFQGMGVVETESIAPRRTRIQGREAKPAVIAPFGAFAAG